MIFASPRKRLTTASRISTALGVVLLTGLASAQPAGVATESDLDRIRELFGRRQDDEAIRACDRYLKVKQDPVVRWYRDKAAERLKRRQAGGGAAAPDPWIERLNMGTRRPDAASTTSQAAGAPVVAAPSPVRASSAKTVPGTVAAAPPPAAMTPAGSRAPIIVQPRRPPASGWFRDPVGRVAIVFGALLALAAVVSWIVTRARQPKPAEGAGSLPVAIDLPAVEAPGPEPSKPVAVERQAAPPPVSSAPAPSDVFGAAAHEKIVHAAAPVPVEEPLFPHLEESVGLFPTSAAQSRAGHLEPPPAPAGADEEPFLPLTAALPPALDRRPAPAVADDSGHDVISLEDLGIDSGPAPNAPPSKESGESIRLLEDEIHPGKNLGLAGHKPAPPAGDEWRIEPPQPHVPLHDAEPAADGSTSLTQKVLRIEAEAAKANPEDTLTRDRNLADTVFLDKNAASMVSFRVGAGEAPRPSDAPRPASPGAFEVFALDSQAGAAPKAADDSIVMFENAIRKGDAAGAEQDWKKALHFYSVAVAVKPDSVAAHDKLQLARARIDRLRDHAAPDRASESV